MDNQIEAMIQKTIDELYANNASKLHQMCNKEMKKFGGIYPKDFDDFYSRVGCEISVAINKYKESPLEDKTFDDYVSGVIKLAVCKEMTYRNRNKRQIIIKKKVEDENGNIIVKKIFVPNVSLDAPINNEDDSVLSDMIASNIDIEKEILEGNEDVIMDEKIEQYLNSLPKIARSIIEMKMQRIGVKRIKKELGLTDKQYSSYMKQATQFEHIRLLHI